MRKELEDNLIRDFPELFKGYTKPMTESLMCFGCECGDGWYDLIYNACKELMGLPAEEIEGLEFEQIKEKFGTIRMYTNYYTNNIGKIIRKAEIESSETCEYCGSKDRVTQTNTGWIVTVCEKHKNLPKREWSQEELNE